jgi:hypothetical protein
MKTIKIPTKLRHDRYPKTFAIGSLDLINFKFTNKRGKQINKPNRQLSRLKK